MTDAEALKQIGWILDQWFKGEITEFDALAKIAYTTGLNQGAK